MYLTSFFRIKVFVQTGQHPAAALASDPPVPHRLIDHGKLLQFLNTNTHEALAKAHRRWVESQLKNAPERQEHFSGSIAVGSQAYIQKVRQALGIKGIGRRMAEARVDEYQLKESMAKYGRADVAQAELHQSALSVINTIPWKWERP